MYAKISSMLDRMANSLESKGLIKEAYELDKIADQFDNRINASIVDKVAYDEVEGDVEDLIEDIKLEEWFDNQNYRSKNMGMEPANKRHFKRFHWLHYVKDVLKKIYYTETGKEYEHNRENFDLAKGILIDLLKLSGKFRDTGSNYEYDIKSISNEIEKVYTEEEDRRKRLIEYKNKEKPVPSPNQNIIKYQNHPYVSAFKHDTNYTGEVNFYYFGIDNGFYIKVRETETPKEILAVLMRTDGIEESKTSKPPVNFESKSTVYKLPGLKYFSNGIETIEHPSKLEDIIKGLHHTKFNRNLEETSIPYNYHY